MPHVFTRPDGSEQKVSGYQFRAPLASAKRYAASSRMQKLPAKVDLRPHLSPVENQGALSSCVANAVAGAYEYLVRRHKEDSDYDVSRLFIYYNARSKQGDVEEDGGSIIADAIQGLREEGACSEETWPYDEDSVNEEPSQEAYDEAAEFLVEDMQLVPCNLESWKTALAEGYPIVFGIGLYDSFDKQRKRGLVPMPSPKEASRASHSGHAMLCVGYSDPDQVFIVRNSWGEDWGDNGYCYIPYNYLMSSRHNDGDSWIIRQLENLDVDAGTWGNEESLIGDLEGELADMSEEDYQDMLDAMGDLHLETRLAMLFLTCAGADGDISDEELEGIAKYVGVLLEQMNSDYSPEKVLRYALKKLDEKRVQESIELFAEHVPQTMLTSILRSLREIVGVDEVSQEEEDFLDALVQAWQIEDLDRGSESDESADEEAEEKNEDDEEKEDADEDNEDDDAEENDEADDDRRKRR